MLTKIFLTLLFVGTLKLCLAQQLIDDSHEPPSGWKKIHIGNTRVIIESPGEFKQELRKEKLIGNTVSFSCETKYALYTVTEQAVLSEDTVLLSNFASQTIARLKLIVSDVSIKSRRKVLIQGLPAIKLEISSKYSGFPMREVCILELLLRINQNFTSFCLVVTCYGIQYLS